MLMKQQMIEMLLLHRNPQVCFQTSHFTKTPLTNDIRRRKNENKLQVDKNLIY